ncbi:hypothetical protein IMSAG025_02339 [Muribaculaceae bacterium]|nr:hypothetical protein IMSAG025_02339 [Muribaculaceae bacterium]
MNYEDVQTYFCICYSGCYDGGYDVGMRTERRIREYSGYGQACGGVRGIGGRIGRNAGNRDSRSTCWGCY